MIKAIIFDVGGVLAHDVWEHLLLDKDGLASICDLDVEKVQEVGKELWERFAYLPAAAENDWRELERQYWRLLTDKLRLSVPVTSLIKMTDKFIRPVEGMTTLLEHLHSQRVELAICSNNTEFWFRRQMDSLDLHKFFEPSKTILSCHIGASKRDTHQKMFHAVIHALEADKNECIFVDDREENVKAGLRVGISGIIFPSHKDFGAHYLGKILEKMDLRPRQ